MLRFSATFFPFLLKLEGIVCTTIRTFRGTLYDHHRLSLLNMWNMILVAGRTGLLTRVTGVPWTLDPAGQTASSMSCMAKYTGTVPVAPHLSCPVLISSGIFFFVVDANFSTNLPVFSPWFVSASAISQKKTSGN